MKKKTFKATLPKRNSDGSLYVSPKTQKAYSGKTVYASEQAVLDRMGGNVKSSYDVYKKEDYGRATELKKGVEIYSIAELTRAESWFVRTMFLNMSDKIYTEFKSACNLVGQAKVWILYRGSETFVANRSEIVSITFDRLPSLRNFKNFVQWVSDTNSRLVLFPEMPITDDNDEEDNAGNKIIFPYNELAKIVYPVLGGIYSYRPAISDLSGAVTIASEDYMVKDKLGKRGFPHKPKWTRKK